MDELTQLAAWWFDCTSNPAPENKETLMGILDTWREPNETFVYVENIAMFCLFVNEALKG